MPQHVKVVVCVLSLAGLAGILSAQGGLVANAGPDQAGVFVGNVVNLSGAGSTGATTFAWAFLTRPSGSAAVLVNPNTVTPSFVPDKKGAYTVRLTVGNGTTTTTDDVVVTTGNRAPVANAGPDTTGPVTDIVSLSGAASTDADGDKLTYAWAVVTAPPTSLGALATANKVTSKLTLDRPGSYVVALVVRDGEVSSAPDLLTVTTTNTAPVANAGLDRRIAAGTQMQLNGAGSSDIDEDPLTYAWTLKRPNGSSASLSDPSSPMPTFVADKTGNYTATLVVSDGIVTHKDSVILATTNNLKPVARSGPDGPPLTLGMVLQLDGGGSTDAGGQLLNYAWTITKRPSGRTATLSGANTPRPTFVVDKAGKYTFTQVITDSAGLTSNDARIFTTAFPQANAGPDQDVNVGAVVTLDGSASSHFTQRIAFGWALVSVPAGSAAALDDPSDPQPRFVADLDGTYVAQLILFDGVKLSPADTVVVSTNRNLAPVVNMGPDRVVTAGVAATLDGIASDPNLDPVAFVWSLLSRPAGSAAALSAGTGAVVLITPDLPGDYIVQVTGTDPGGLSSVDTLTLTTGNTAPDVVAEDDRLVAAGIPVVADADAADPDGGAVSYEWRMLRRPPGSTASLSGASSAAPAFTPDVVGAYVVQVVVRDAFNLFAIDSVVYRVPAGVNEPPVANAGSDQVVAVGGLAQLTGSGSSDPEDQTLSYAWQFLSKPAGSAATLSSTSIVNPTFTPDVPGEYELELVVNDGVQDSAPDTVIVQTPLLLALSPHALSIPTSSSGGLTVSIAYAAPSDLVVAVGSSNTSVATVPSTVTILEGATSANFNVTGGTTTGGVIVTASAPGTSAAHATVAVGSRLVQWTDDVSGSWDDNTKWTDDIKPGVGDVVVIDRPAGSFTVTVGAPTAAIASLFAAEQVLVPSTLTVNGAAAFDGGLTLSGTLNGAGSATIGSAMAWDSGVVSLGGGLEILNGRTMTFANNGQGRTLVATTLRNHGTVAQGTGNALVLNGGGTVAVINESDGLWTTNDNVMMSNGAGPLSFTNLGILRKVGGSGQLWLTGHFLYANSGTIDIQSGSIAVGLGGYSATLTNSGAINAGTGTTIYLHQVTLAAGSTFSGTGTLIMDGTTTVTTDLTLGLPTELSSLVTGSGAIHMAAAMIWHGGTMSLAGGLEILPAGSLSLGTSGSTHFLTTGTSLRNYGAVSWTVGGSLQYTGGSITVRNESGATWTFGTGGYSLTSNGAPTPAGSFTFLNAGTMTGAGASTTLTVVSAVSFTAGSMSGITVNFVP
jgi:PKD domain/K319L-like, PKD domain